MPQHEESSFINHYETYRQRGIRPPMVFETTAIICDPGKIPIPWLWIAAGVIGGLALSGLTSKKVRVKVEDK